MCVFVFKQKTACEMRISDWSSDVCSSDLRPRRRPRDLRVEIAVDDVVIDASRAAHDDRAEKHPQEQRPVADRPAAEREAPGAWPVKQPPADRPVEAREQRIGPRRGGEQRDEAAKLAVGGGGGRARKSGRQGKRGSVRVDFGGRRNLNKK